MPVTAASAAAAVGRGWRRPGGTAGPGATATATPGRPTAEQRRNLAGSVRRLTGLVAAYATVSAVIVFLFFPRGPGAGLFGAVRLGTRGRR